MIIRRITSAAVGRTLNGRLFDHGRCHLQTRSPSSSLPWLSSIGQPRRPSNDAIMQFRYMPCRSYGGKRPKTHYDVLGVPMDCRKEVIKKRFYELSKKYHPDRQRGSTSDSTKARQIYLEISEAYNILSDDTLRQQYDMSLGDPSSRTTYAKHDPAARESNSSGYGSGRYQGTKSWDDRRLRRQRKPESPHADRWRAHQNRTAKFYHLRKSAEKKDQVLQFMTGESKSPYLYKMFGGNSIDTGGPPQQTSVHESYQNMQPTERRGTTVYWNSVSLGIVFVAIGLGMGVFRIILNL